MRTIYKYSMLSALALGLVSCQQSDSFTELQQSREMSFQIVAPGVHTRVANDTFEEGDQIGI